MSHLAVLPAVLSFNLYPLIKTALLCDLWNIFVNEMKVNLEKYDMDVIVFNIYNSIMEIDVNLNVIVPE